MNFKITIFGFLSLMTLPTFSQSGINQQQTNFIGSNAYLLAFDQPGQSFTVSVSSKITKIEEEKAELAKVNEELTAKIAELEKKVK